MTEVEQLESRIKNLSPQDLAKFRAWYAGFDEQIWDRQIEADSKAGKLNNLIENSLAEHVAGKSRPL